MATYTYRCTSSSTDESRAADPGHSRFDLTAPIGTARDTVACPRCGSDAVRVFSPPMISRAHPGALAAIERAEQSRTEPAVVGAIPGRVGRRASTTRRDLNPALAKLPRP